MDQSAAASGKDKRLICMAEIVGVHGVKGWVKLKIFAKDPERLLQYSPFLKSDGSKGWEIMSLQTHGGIYLAQLGGVSDRNAAERLKGEKLFVSREVLPDLQEEGVYYYEDLIGLAAKDKEGKAIGTIIRVINFGAGDLLEIKPLKGASYYVPFTAAVVPEVDIQAGFATVIVPHGLLDEKEVACP